MERATHLLIFFLFIFAFGPKTDISLATQSHRKGIDYREYVKDATQFASEEFYDYIVVGGGTAGCPLAATLSQQHSVLLLERGPSPDATPQVFLAENFVNVLLEANDVDSPAQAFISEDGVLNARARVLGGSSMINAGFYSRSNKEFYTEMGVEWDWPLVAESYQWVEETVTFKISLNTWQSSVKEALLDAGNGPYRGFTLDHIEGVKIGGTIFDATGRRHGSVELLGKGNPNNLKVAVNATVERIIFHNSESLGLSAIGVIYSDAKNGIHRAMLHEKGEVILSAGAIGSPQLLLLSGVGPTSYLSSLNISVVHNLSFVGQLLADNPRNGLSIIPPFPMEDLGLGIAAITKHGYHIEATSGVYPFYSPVDPSLFPGSSPPVSFPALTIFEKLSEVVSTGSLHLKSPTDVRVSPDVRFNYFSDPKDLATCVKGMRNVERALRSHAMEKYKYRDLEGNRGFKFVGGTFSTNKTDDASIESFCKKTIATIWHYHGGCVMGKVVDKDFKVMGINALRVVDGSTFTSSPGTNPQATVMMLGRYMGLKIGEQGTKK